jgi:hypothetical protein
MSPNSSYDPTQVLRLFYNQAQYYTVMVLLIYSNLVAAVSQISTHYQLTIGVNGLSSLLANVKVANKVVFLLPIGFTLSNIQPFAFSATYLTNTIMFIYPPQLQFFMVMLLNRILGIPVYTSTRLSKQTSLCDSLSAYYSYLSLGFLGWDGCLFSKLLVTYKQWIDIGLL